MAIMFVPSHVNETSDPVDNLGGILSVVLVGALILAINFAPVPSAETAAIALGLLALAAGIAFYIRQRARAEPALRPERRGPARLLGRRVRGDHRVRLAHGRGVREPAVPPERARLLDARGRRRDPAGGLRHGARRAALGQARRRVRRPLHAALRLRVPLPRVPLDAPALGRGEPVLAGRDRLRLHRRRRRTRGHSGLALADRLGAGARAPGWPPARRISSATSAARS